MKKFLMPVIALAILPACSLQHNLNKDYPNYIASHPAVLPAASKQGAYGYNLPTTTQNFNYEFRAASTGAAHLWQINFGQVLDDTLQSKDVQKAFGSLVKLEGLGKSDKDVLVFNLKNAAFEHYATHLTLDVSVSRDGKVIFNKTYIKKGDNQAAKMWLGGAFAQKNAVYASTKSALDALMTDLINDLNKTAP